MVTHPGEEFVYVIEGPVVFASAGLAEQVLQPATARNSIPPCRTPGSAAPTKTRAPSSTPPTHAENS